jgi:hypothetical protein
MGMVRGSLERGMFSEPASKIPSKAKSDVTQKEIIGLLRSKFGLEPFAFLGSNVDENDPRWLSFLAASIHRKDGATFQRTLMATWVERLYLNIYHRVTGCFPFYQRQNAKLLALQMLLNGAAGGGITEAIRFLIKGSGEEARISSKREREIIGPSDVTQWRGWRRTHGGHQVSHKRFGGRGADFIKKTVVSMACRN